MFVRHGSFVVRKPFEPPVHLPVRLEDGCANVVEMGPRTSDDRIAHIAIETRRGLLRHHWQLGDEVQFPVVRKTFQHLKSNVFEYIIHLLIATPGRKVMPQPVVVPNLLPIDVDVSALSAFEVVKGDRKTGEIISIVANDKFIESIQGDTADLLRDQRPFFLT